MIINFEHIRLIGLAGYCIGILIVAIFGLDIIETAMYTIEDPVPLLSVCLFALILMAMVNYIKYNRSEKKG